jgi:malate dehydrogenase
LLATGPNTQPFYQKTVIISTDRPIRFAEAVIKALRGETGIVEPTFVYLPGIAGGDEIAKATGVEFFSTLVTLGANGAEKVTNVLDGVTDQEKKLLEACTKGLKGNIEKGIDFIKNPPPK